MSGEVASTCPSCGKHEVRHEFDLGCEICAACGHVLSDRALQTSVTYDEDGAQGVFLHDGETRGQHLAAARHSLAIAPGATPGVTRAMFRDEASTHLANISRAVDFAAQQLRLSKDSAADARQLVVRASEGRWGDGDWTTLLVGAAVYVAARQNGLPIAMRDVAEACQLDVFALGRVYNKLKRLHDVRVPPLDPDAFVARAAAAVPELTKESIKGVTVGKGHVRVREDSSNYTQKSTQATRSKGKGAEDSARGTVELTPEKTTASRAKDLAPIIADAKILLQFASKRGLITGRNPVPFVAASLGIASEARGVDLSHEKTAAAARSSIASARRASVTLREELVQFANTFEWGADATLKTLHVYLPSLVQHVAGTLHTLKEQSTGRGLDITSSEKASTSAASRMEGMPVSFRAHEKTRVKRHARLAKAKHDTLVALGITEVGGVEGTVLIAGEENQTEGDESRAVSTLVDAPAPVLSVKRPTRGGVRRSKKSIKASSIVGNGVSNVVRNGVTKSPVASNKKTSDDGELDFDWRDIELQKLLLEGVPETYLMEEQGLHPVEGSGVVSDKKEKEYKKRSHTSVASATNRVRQKVQNDLHGRDFLLGGVSAFPGGVTWKPPCEKAIERFDAEAIDLIPDSEIDELMRTPEEVALAKAVADSALGGGRSALDAATGTNDSAGGFKPAETPLEKQKNMKMETV